MKDVIILTFVFLYLNIREIDAAWLSTFFDTDRAYAFKVEGDCCWEIFSEKAFKGDSKKLVPKLNSGFAGIPGYPKFKANSLKKVPC